MIEADLKFVQKLVADDRIKSPCLELGTGYGGATSKEILSGVPNLQYVGTDLSSGPNVDFVADFEDPPEEIARAFERVEGFSTILILNVLEHCFDPIRVLDNAIRLLRRGGLLVAIAPAVWPLHDYPRDCWRINPNFYEEYARRRGLDLVPEYFEFLGQGHVSNFRDRDGAYQFPQSAEPPLKQLYSRVVHRALNTSGRGMRFPSFVGIGAVLRKPA